MVVNSMKELETKLLNLLEPIKTTLPNDEFDLVKMFIIHRDWGVSLEYLCMFIDNHSIPITIDYYREIATLGTQMKMNSNNWEFISYLIQPRPLNGEQPNFDDLQEEQA